MNYFFTDERIQKNINSFKTIFSPELQGTLINSSSILEGVYISYQISDLNVTLGTSGTSEVSNPQDNHFYHNTDTKESFRYFSGTWSLLTEPLLSIIVEGGFSSQWRPLTTLIREDDYLEVIIPKDFLPININDSQTVFLGFKDLMVTNDKIKPVIGIPLVDNGERFYSREVNTVIRFPFSITCNFLPILDSNTDLLDNSLDYDRDKHKTINYILSEYKSYSSTNSDLDSPNLNGSTLKF